MVRQFIIVFIFLASAYFYKTVFLPQGLILVFQVAAIGLMLLTILFGIIYDHGKKGFKQNFGFEVGVMIVASIASLWGAYWGHGQNIVLTAFAQKTIYFYLFYFFLHVLRMNPQNLERLLLSMAIAFAVLFFLQYAIYPTRLMNVAMRMQRGTIRIFMPGMAFADLVFFYFFLVSLRTNNYRYFVICGVYLVMIILMGTRQVLLVTAVGMIAALLLSKHVESKPIMVLLISAGGVLIFFIFQDIFNQLIEVSAEQSASTDEKDDIRIRAARFYLTEFQEGLPTYILGNGAAHESSLYGLKFVAAKEMHGYYLSDIGIIGSYVKYGALSVLSVILILRKIFILKVEPQYQFIKYWSFSLIFFSILAAPFFQGNYIVAILSSLYLMDVSNHNLRLKEYKRNKAAQEVQTE